MIVLQIIPMKTYWETVSFSIIVTFYRVMCVFLMLWLRSNIELLFVAYRQLLVTYRQSQAPAEILRYVAPVAIELSLEEGNGCV